MIEALERAREAEADEEPSHFQKVRRDGYVDHLLTSVKAYIAEAAANIISVAKARKDAPKPAALKGFSLSVVKARYTLETIITIQAVKNKKKGRGFIAPSS
ncbi:MAG: hypothetical protein QXP83_07880 [Candidatus Nezhaarchaeales archaeon]